jgi:nucleoside transporter
MSKTTIRILLGAMMFFQYAAWGAWAPVLGATLGKAVNEGGLFGASGTLIGAVFGVLWLACIFVPFVGGQLVDRAIPGQLYMGASAVVCAGTAWVASQQTRVGNLLPEIFPIVPTGGFALWLVLWAIAFAPTIGIGNSLCLHFLSREEGSTEAERERAFSVIRTMGTIGWIVVAFVEGWAKTQFPKIPIVEFSVSAIAAILWAVCSFTLPNVPPAKQGVDPFAFKKAFALFGKVPGFTAFMLISLVASAEFQFFYTLSGQFLGSLGVPDSQLAPYKSTSQMAEVLALAILLPICLKKFGMRWTLVVGTLAWSLRYFIFATKVFLPVVLSLSLHGIGFAFVFITSYFYIDRVAPKDIRASAQSLFTLVTLGVGNWLGSILSGKLQDAFTTKVGETATVNWPMVFIVPAILTLVSAIAFFATFKEPAAQSESDEELRAAPAH